MANPRPSELCRGRPAITTPAVTVARRRGGDIHSGDVIRLPRDVYVAVRDTDASRDYGVRTWRRQLASRLANPHPWRWVYDVDDPTGSHRRHRAGFRVLRVSDDHPDQGREYRLLVLAVREFVAVEVQVRGTDTDGAPS